MFSSVQDDGLGSRVNHHIIVASRHRDIPCLCSGCHLFFLPRSEWAWRMGLSRCGEPVQLGIVENSVQGCGVRSIPDRITGSQTDSHLGLTALMYDGVCTGTSPSISLSWLEKVDNRARSVTTGIKGSVYLFRRLRLGQGNSQGQSSLPIALSCLRAKAQRAR